jgi:hypothetical protein
MAGLLKKRRTAVLAGALIVAFILWHGSGAAADDDAQAPRSKRELQRQAGHAGENKGLAAQLAEAQRQVAALQESSRRFQSRLRNGKDVSLVAKADLSDTRKELRDAQKLIKGLMAQVAVGQADSGDDAPVTKAAEAGSEEEEGDAKKGGGGKKGEEPAARKEGEEYNVVPEDARNDAERAFHHSLTAPLPELDASAPREEHAMHKAFTLYNKDPKAATTVPVYGTACIGTADCSYVKDQLASLDTGVAHVIVVMNADHGEFKKYFSALAAKFAGRFTFYYHPEILSCPESWNVILKSAYAIRPEIDFAMVTNGDLWALPSYLAKFAQHVRKEPENTAASKFVHFSSYALHKSGWKNLGPFDEVIFPAYAEDVEYHIRMVSRGMFMSSFPGSRQDTTFKHIGSRSHSDGTFKQRIDRWDQNDYMFRKWNVNMKMYADYANCRPFKHPWNQPALTHRTSFRVDPVHRECLKTGKGPRHSAHGRCYRSACNSCYYNASVLYPMLPKDTVLPDSILTQNRVQR